LAIHKRVTGRGAAISASEKRDREREEARLASFFHPGVSCVHPPWMKMQMRPSGRKWPTGRLFIANLEDTFTGHGVIRNICSMHKETAKPAGTVTGGGGHRSVAMSND